MLVDTQILMLTPCAPASYAEGTLKIKAANPPRQRGFIVPVIQATAIYRYGGTRSQEYNSRKANTGPGLFDAEGESRRPLSNGRHPLKSKEAHNGR